MSARTEVLDKLHRVIEKEWAGVMKVCKEHINMKVRHKTLFGAHSQVRLGMDPFQFYFHEALTKLYEGVWDWQYEKFSLLEQMKRIIDSIISEEVRKSKTAKEKKQTVRYMDLFMYEESPAAMWGLFIAGVHSFLTFPDSTICSSIFYCISMSYENDLRL